MYKLYKVRNCRVIHLQTVQVRNCTVIHVKTVQGEKLYNNSCTNCKR